jgi:hypothetical protein
VSKFFNFFDRFKRCVDWFDMLKLPGVFDRFGPRVDSINRSNIRENENKTREGAVTGYLGEHLSHRLWDNYE